MNMLKRSFAMLLALCMLVSAVPVNAIAAEATDLTEPIVLETDAPEVTEAPIESETPTESEVPTESEIPTEGETIGEEETPTEGVTVPEEETPTEGATVPEEETPTEGVTIPEEETVPEETEEFFEIGWVSEEEISGITMGTKPADGTTTGEPFPQLTGGSNSFRIPALVTLSDGTLVAAADARWNTTYDGGGLDTIVSRSSDNGATWKYTFANYLGDNGNVNNASSTAFIDPALAVTSDDTIYMLVDLYPYGVALNGGPETYPVTTKGFNANGKLLLSGDNHSSYSYYLDGDTIYSSSGAAVSGYTVDEYFNITDETGATTNLFFSDSPYKVVRTGFLYLTKSTDKGASWSEPTLLNLKTTSEQVCLVGPGRGLVTDSGMIVFPVYSYNGSQSSQMTGFIYSNDGGSSWSRSSNFTGASWSSESAVVELEDGTLRFFYRNGTTNLCYVDYKSGWGSPVTMTNIDTNSNCQISAITYSKTIDGKQVILVSCPTGPSEAGSDQSGASYRLNGKIFLFTVGEDNGLTLVNSKNVTSDGAQFMYSCLTEQKDGSVSILYEDKENAWGTGDSCYYTMSFATYNVEETFGVTFDAVVNNAELTDKDTNVKVQFANTDNQTYTMTVTPNQTVAALKEEYVAFDVTITNAGGTKYEGSASVTLPLGALADKTGIYPFVVETDGTVTKIETFTVENGTITFTAPHFSVLGAAVEAQEPVISGEDTVTSNGQSGTAYVLDTDGVLNADTTYLIVNTSADGTGNALTLNGYNATGTEVKISGGTISVDADENMAFVISNNTIKNGNHYVSPTYGKVNVTTGAYTLNIVSKGNGAYNINYYNYYSLLFSNSTWTGIYAYNDTSNLVYLYEKTSAAAWTVDAALQESRIAAYTVENEGYTDASWNAYQAALTAAQNKLAEVEGATYTTEVAANTAKTDLIAVVDALEEAKNALVKAVAITIQYQAAGATVVTATLNVAVGAGMVTLPERITDANGDMYTVNNTTLLLTGATAYNVPVTKLEGYPITVSRGSEITVSPADPYGDGSVDGVELTSGQYIKWSSEDSAYVGVAGVYNANTLAYTDEAVIKGTQETETFVKVTGTVYNADGTVASTHNWFVTVTAPASGTTAVYRYYDVDQIENCTLYYSINGGNLVQINGTGLAIDYIDPQQNDDPYTVMNGAWYDDMSLIFFAAPDEGYALTHLYVEDSANQYYVLSDGNADGTGSSAWPLKDGVSADAVYTSGGHTYSLSEVASLYLLNNKTIYEAIKSSDNVWKSLDTNNDGIVKSDEYHGLRWALLEGYMDINHLKALYTEALALGCTGITTVTKGTTNNSGIGTANDPISICAVAQKLPTLEKKISSITKADGSTISGDNVAAAALEIGDTLHYTLDVTVYATDSRVRYWDGTSLASGSTATISYSNINVTDTMKNLNWTNTTATSSTSSDQHLTTTYQITLAASNWLQYVENGKILNTAELTYDYVASYGTGSYGGKSEASVEAYVVLPEYVIDFGASIEIDLTNDPLVAGYDKLRSAEAMYGDIQFNEDTLKMTYTPNQILPGIDFIRIEVEDTTGSQEDSLVGYGVRIYPATTVYYEEGFIFDSSKNWDTENVSMSPGKQTSEKLSPATRDANGVITGYYSDKQNPYGYDALYASDINGSNDSEASAESIGATTSFTFTGTGFDLYANCTESTGRVSVQVRNTAGKLVKVYTVDTVVKGGETVATAGQTGSEYHLPIVSVDSLEHGTYTVSLVKIAENEKPVKIDGVRIHNTLKDSSVFTIDKEDNPVFYELRDAVLKAVDVNKTASEMYGAGWMNDKSLIGPLAEQVYGALSTTDTVSAVVTSVSDIYSGDADAQDLLDNGPKNELFLYPDQTLTFKVTTDREMQIGLKAPRAATSYTLTYEVDNVTKAVATEKTLNTSVDMFYALGNPTGTSTEYTVSVTNTGNDILSVTDLKICDDPNAAFVPLTVDDIEYILTQAGVGGQEPAPEEPIVPEEPEVPVIEYADAVLKINLVDYTGKQLAAAELTANGIKGEENAFAGAAVLRMAERNLPKGYALVSKQADAVKVAYGEETTISVQIGKVATVKVTFVNLLGRKVGTATITKVQTDAAPCRITAAEIRSLAPVGRLVIRLTSVTAAFGSTTNVIVPVV